MPSPTLATDRFSELGSAFEKLRAGQGAVRVMAQHLVELAFRDLAYALAGGLIVPQLGDDSGVEQEFVASASSAASDTQLKDRVDKALSPMWRSPAQEDVGAEKTLDFNKHSLVFVPISYGFDRPVGFFFALVDKPDTEPALFRLRYISKHAATSMRAEKTAHALDELAASILVTAVTTDEVARKIARAAQSALSCSAVVVWRLNNNRLHTIAAVGSAEGIPLNMRADQGIAGRCAMTYQNILVDDLLDSAELTRKGLKVHHENVLQQKKWRSALFVPLDIGGQAAGVFAAYGPRARGFSTIDQTIALAFSQRLSAGYAHAQRIQHLQVMEAKITLEADAIEAGLLALENVHDAINDLGMAQNELNHIKQDFGDQVPSKAMERIGACAGQLASGLSRIAALANRARFREILHRPTQLRGLLDSCVDRIRNRASGSKIRVSVTCPADLTLNIDRDKMGRVFLNFLYNSVYFLDRDGKGQQKQIEIVAQHAEDSGGVSIRFWDNGPGIDSNSLPQVFDYFFTTKGDRGLGFGLAIAKRLVEQGHSGSIKARSNWGFWTEFQVDLPATLVVESTTS